MRLILNAALFVLLALGIGLGMSYFSLVEGRFLGAANVGPWETWPEVGSPTPDPYTKAFLARSSHLQLGRSEGVQFTAINDSSGTPLDANCNYQFTGTTPVATFWTLRATDLKGRNIAAQNSNEAIHSARIVRHSNGITTVNVGPHVKPGNWLPIEKTGPFQLVLTFYDASFLAGFGKTVPKLPAIIREDCQ